MVVGVLITSLLFAMGWWFAGLLAIAGFALCWWLAGPD